MTKTIAQKANHNFDNGHFRIFDENDNETYYETPNGFWEKWKFNENGNKIYYERSDGFWEKWEFDSFDFETYYENSKRIKS